MRRAALTVLAALAVAAGGCGGREPGAVRAPGAAHPLVFFDERAFARALALAERAAPAPVPGARVVIVPHHWVAGHLIVSGLRDLAAAGSFRRVILVGPNHTGAGGAPVSSSIDTWRTPFGPVGPDRELIGRLVSGGLASSVPGVLTFEHSIGGLVPVVARLMPGARVVPLALRSRLRLAEVRRLAEALAPAVDGRTAIVASVDFSHYLSANEARLRDRESVAALRSLDAARVLTFGNDHMDSPPTIALVMEIARMLGATRFELRADTNSAEILGGGSGGVTSYIHGFYH